jgi:hypothetical protein
MLCAPPPQQTWQSIEIFEDKTIDNIETFEGIAQRLYFSVGLVLSRPEHVMSVVGFRRNRG